MEPKDPSPVTSGITPQPEDAAEIRRRRIVTLVEQSIQRQKRLALSKKFHR